MTNLENQEADAAAQVSRPRTALTARVDAAHEAYTSAEEAWRAAQLDLHNFDIAEAGIAEGDIVVHHDGGFYRVCTIETYEMSGRPLIYLYGNPRRKDGSFGRGRRYIGSEWTRADAVGDRVAVQQAKTVA